MLVTRICSRRSAATADLERVRDPLAGDRLPWRVRPL
jgi:hypothetical protein